MAGKAAASARTAGNDSNGAKRRKLINKPSNRPRIESSSSGSEGSEDEDGEEDKAAMLAMLQAHSRAMFGMDGPDEAESSTQAQNKTMATSESSDEDSDEGDEDEDEDAEDFDSDDGWGEGDEMVTDSEDESQAISLPVKPAKPSVPEVVFAETGRSTKPEGLSNAERRAFLKGSSAKMMGIKATPDFIPKRLKRALGADSDNDEDNDEDKELESSNLKLDKTLHNMLLTTLLPSAEQNAALRPVDKRKAMNGRLLELASYQLPGEGSKHVDSKQLSSHSAKIRTGIVHAKQKREQKAREEAEAAGSFVRGFGGLGGEGKGYKQEKGRGMRAALGEDTGKKKGMASRKDQKRDRGLGSGFGKFEGGMLKLSEREIARGSNEGQGRGSKSGGRGKKRGGGRR